MTTGRPQQRDRASAAVPAPAHRTAAGHAHRILDAIRQPLVVLDAELCVIAANRAFYRAFAVTAAETIGQPLAAAGHRCLDVPALQGFLDLIQGGGAIEDYEIEIELPARGRRVLLLTVDTIRGEPREILVALDDVTERLHAEMELKAAKWHAERANLGKSRFVAAVGHDLRQPLQTLVLTREILASRIKDEEILKFVGKLKQATSVLTSVLDTLLDVNQLEAGIVRAENVDFPIDSLLEPLRAEFADEAQARGLRWRVVSCRLRVWSDPNLLRQMIRTLVANALKYTDRGKILLGCRRRGDKLRIEVCDTGVGLSESQIQAIFGEFHQLDGAAYEYGRSLGLGLAIVQRLGELLGHVIDVRSRPGAGSVFAVEVPLSREPALAPVVTDDPALRERRGADPKDPAQAPTIFVVDDDSGVREAMRELLRKEGWAVEVYPSGEAFLEFYRPGRAGCLVVDARMPRMGGMELLERLKEEGGGPPAIMITGHADIRLAVRAMKAGAVSFLEKPVQYDELVATIERALDLTRNSAALAASREAAARRIASLTSREHQVLKLVVEGNPNKQIAYVLGISQRTVETHRATVMKKLGARSLSELVHLTIAGSPDEL
jgi:two-component system CheB/CheR fusion protein